ncbi:hypothetical protein SAMN05660776_1010 [Salegentibacter holothuriorum]|uniref:Uncharacterized protein n=2 Tax=Salegentibacter holothuriorum TaxID=241145 RepID=A0A1T5B0I6_9FLAO|nr:hypothetical protein SAMN05660776_1010 [Salegentibacter holothuriorum]
MIIYFKKKRLNSRLFNGIASIIMGLLSILSDFQFFFVYAWLILGILQIGTWYYQNKFQYLQIENNVLTKNSLFPKSIELSKITALRKYRNSFRIESKKQNIKIYKDVISTDSLYQLTDLLNEIQVNNSEASS